MKAVKELMLRLFRHAAKRQNKSGDFRVWTHENHAIETTGNAFIESKVKYIHENQVRAGISETLKNTYIPAHLCMQVMKG